MKKHTILAFMQDNPGVLNKISMLIRRKMYNIDTLTVCETMKKNISRMTISLHSKEQAKINQMIKQIEKIVEVISAKELDPDDSFWRELALIKVEIMESKLKKLHNKYFFQILDKHNKSQFIVQASGTMQDIDSFIEELGKKNIVEIARTGPTAIER